MKKNSENIEQIEKLEEELRKLAVPYTSEEPGPLYWANFRVRVMERVAQNEEKANIWAKMGAFIAQHTWQSSIAISAAALLIIGIVLNPLAEHKTVSSVPVGPAPVASVIVPPVVSAPMMQPAEKAAPEHAVSEDHASNVAPAPLAPTHVASASDANSDLAIAAEPLSDASDHPVSLEDLSTPELESVLQGLQSNQ